MKNTCGRTGGGGNGSIPASSPSRLNIYMDIDISHTAGYGNVLVWTAGAEPGLGEQLVNIPEELNKEKFYKMFN